jgi:sulfatase maturation enzyme AslB (radical SAM superfamily)
MFDTEVFRKAEYRPFTLKGEEYFLNLYPYLDIVLNDHCNAKCKFCIGHLIHEKMKANIQKYKSKISYAIEKLGVKEVLLLGGEPTINDDVFEIIDHLKTLPLNKICITTNGHRIAKDIHYAQSLLSSGITHINLSLMSLDPDKQRYISGSKTFFGLTNLRALKELCDLNGVVFRINNNVFRGNNETTQELLDFYNSVKDYCHNIKFSPLLKTDTFSTVNEVTEFNGTHILSDDEYDDLWHSMEDFFLDYPIVRNELTLGFVEYSTILLPTPIIFNYNQHGQLMKKVVLERQINGFKLLPTGDLSLSWNREDDGYFIDTEELK